MWLVGLLVLAALTLLAARADARTDSDLDLADTEIDVEAGSDLDPVSDLGPGNDVFAQDEGVAIDDDGSDDAWASGFAGRDEQDEAARQRQRSSGWGRLDVSLAWRHHESVSMTASIERARDELWLFATWRR